MNTATIRQLTTTAVRVAGGLETYTLTEERMVRDVRDGSASTTASTPITVSGREVGARTGERSSVKRYLILDDLVARGGKPDRRWWLTGKDGVQRRVAPDPTTSAEHMNSDGRAWTVVVTQEGSPNA